MSRSKTNESNIEAGHSSKRNEKYSIHFSRASIRAAFVRKVFFLVFIMLSIVAAISAVPLIVPEFGEWCRINYGWQFLALGVFLVLYIVIMCFTSVRRRFPCNLILLTIFTFSAAIMTMFAVARFSAESVTLTFAITAACTFGIILFATCTKLDLTSCMGIAFLLGLFLFIFGIVAAIVTIFLKTRILMVIYSGLGSLLMMFYLAIDIQLLMGGRKNELSPEDYIFAAMEIFVDILNLFLMLLGIFGKE